MRKSRTTRTRWGLTAAAALAAGSVCQTCEVRLRDAFVDGTRNYVSSLLDPTDLLQLLIEESGNGTDGP